MRSLGRAVAALACALAAGPALASPDFVSEDRMHPVAVSDGGAELQPADDVVFAYDSAALLPAAQAQIASAAKWLERHPDYRLVIEGRADSSGPSAYNEDLAGRRATIVRNHLISIGIASDRLVLAIYGENTARPDPDELDRRCVMFASKAPLAQVISAELDREAIEAQWTRNGTQFRETRGITPVATLEPPVRTIVAARVVAPARRR